MKILAIRGRNLASLQGDFQLDFTSDPLFGCGLFAITGETGAGKSTILDAMCLALYGRYPRISGSGDKNKVANIKGEALATSDPRSILRTGCADAYAQVDLMVGDQMLQASWQVRRAYGKADGNLLDFERALIDLKDNSVLASGKKRVDEEIAERLKLTYEQFGRTVLLAQNDFDAFLRATDGDRADLLEKITGTELYSKISAKAFESERQALRALEELQRETGYIAVLPGEDRAELLELVKSTERNHLELGEKCKKVRADLDWYGRHDEAVKRLSEAQKQAEQAEKQLAKAGDEKQRLSNIELARSLRGLIDKVALEERALAAYLEEQSSDMVEQKQLLQRLETTGCEEKKFGDRLVQSERALKSAAELFERALALDTQISSSLEHQRETQAALTEVNKSQVALKQQRGEQRAAGKRMSERLNALQDARLRDAGIEQVSKRAQDLSSLFLTFADLRVKRDDLHVLQRGMKQSNEILFKQLDQNKQHARTIRDRLVEARARREEKETVLKNSQPGEARLKRDHHADCQNQLNSLHHHLERVVEQRDLIEKTKKTRRGAKAKISKADKDLHVFEETLSDLNSRSAEAHEVLTRSKNALSKQVLSLRAELQEDEPCIVCGAIDHPGHDDEATNELLELMRTRTSELAQEISRAEKERNRVRQGLEYAKAMLESAVDRRSSAKDRLEGLQLQTENLFREVEEATTPLGLKLVDKKSPKKLLAHILELREINEHQMIDGRKQLLVIQQLEAEIRTLAEQVLVIEKELQTQLEEIDALAKSGQKSSDETRDLEVKLGHVVEHYKLILDQIVAMLSGLDVSRADLEHDPSSVEQFLKKQIARYEQQQREAREVKEDLEKMQRDSVVLTEKNEHLLSRSGELGSQLKSEQERLIKQQREREKLFDGVSVSVVRSQMEQTRQRDAKALQETIVGKREIATRLDVIEKNLLRLEGLIKTSGRSKQNSRKVRDAGLLQKNLELAQALSLLATPDEETQKIKQRIDQLVHNQTKSIALLLDRKQLMQDIESQSRPSGECEEFVSQLREIEADMAMLMIDLGKNRSTLELDDAALKQRKQLSGKIDRVEKKHALWAVISGAIGSKTGDKFRRFAQGVTLDHLIALANQQLRTINPRYKIERNSIGGLGLQVMDIEMGGEIRSVRSLSGGERFLVSLALALGLSRLDGRSSYVDTLMIDEGFGALDARSLDIVIEALESLQSQGRKVGVISHIEALTERIPVQVRVEKQGSGRSRVRVVEQGMTAQ